MDAVAKKVFKPCPFCGNKDPNAATENMRAVVCDATRGGCGACGGFASTPEAANAQWNQRAFPPDPRTCETCAIPYCEQYGEPCPNWTPRSPQSADVETVRSKIELAIKFGFPIDARIALRDALAALDRLAGKVPN